MQQPRPNGTDVDTCMVPEPPEPTTGPPCPPSSCHAWSTPTLSNDTAQTDPWLPPPAGDSRGSISGVGKLAAAARKAGTDVHESTIYQDPRDPRIGALGFFEGT